MNKCRDPLANSFIAPLAEDPADDARLKSEDYERSAEDDAEYGIDHLKLHERDGNEAAAAAAGPGEKAEAAAGGDAMAAE